MQRLALERRSSSDQMIENGSQRINVASRTHFRHGSQSLFWGDVSRRTKRLAGQCEVGIRIRLLCQTEIRDPRLIERINENIGRFEVAMEYSFLMCVMNGLGNRLKIPGCAPRRKRFGPYQLGKTPPLHKIHREVILSFGLADFVNGHDIRVLKACSRGGLLPEPLHKFRTGKLAGQDHLNRDLTVQTLLPRAKNDAHAAARHFPEQFVVPKRTRKVAGRRGYRSEIRIE